uniref:Rhodopsin domain-containing protein n=1 Tax=Bionectria ochroleuca TaxID=29856 RepID=A0A8H7TN64_BIOOC
MAIKDDAVWSIAVMWVMTVIVLAFTGLRVYTRAFVVKSFGGDDWVYVFAFFCFLMYATFVSVAGVHGYGQDMVIVQEKPDEMKKAIIYLAVGQTFAMVGMTVAKWSLGLFLLRLVESAWHKTSIWMTLVLLAIASLLSTFVFWFQCSPPRAMWDRTLPGAKCEVPQLPFFYFLGATCAFADLFFALVPWWFMWNLQMNKREKLIILFSLSLGVIAAAFGFKRCTEIYKLVGQNFLKDVVSIIIWAAAEIAVTMVCIGIPICRPLYKDYLSRLSSRDTSKYKGLSGERRGGGGKGERPPVGDLCPCAPSGVA